MLRLTPDTLSGLPQNGRTDPIEYYRRPFVGYLFRERINMGLRLLGDRHFPRGLEVGYGAGAVLASIAPSVTKLAGIDLDADPEPVRRALERRGLSADIQKGSVYELPYADASFDLVVCMEPLGTPDRLAMSEAGARAAACSPNFVGRGWSRGATRGRS